MGYRGQGGRFGTVSHRGDNKRTNHKVENKREAYANKRVWSRIDKRSW